MEDSIKNLICSRLLDYLKIKVKNFKYKGKLFTCPLCRNKELSANLIPKSNYKAYCFRCSSLGNIFKIVQKLEPDKKDWDEDKIANYLKDLFKIEDVDMLDIYKKYKWSLLPLEKDKKKPIEKSWTQNIHYDKKEWMKWLYAGNNVGLRTGKVSGITVIDVDIKENIFNLDLSKYLVQETKKGYHLIFDYCPDIPNIPQSKIEEFKMDVCNDGRQIVIEPSKIKEFKYSWKNLGMEIPVMPKEIKEKLLRYITEPTQNLLKPTLELPEEERENIIPIIPDSSEIKMLNEGVRDSTLTSIGGKLRKKYNLKETIYLLDFMNRTFCKPTLPYEDVVKIVKSLQGYQEQEEITIKETIYDYARQQGDFSSRDVKESLSISKGIVDKYLSEFAKEGKLIRLGRGRYRYKEKIEWSDQITEQIKGLGIEIPYFNNVAYFESGDIILIGGGGKIGKTTIALNIVKRLVDQGIKPYYIYSESGSRFIKIIKALGLKNGEFYHTFNLNPLSIELEKNSITILDWLLISDKSISDTIFKHLTEEMQRKGGLLFVFMQLKENDNWFAPNMVKQFPALAGRYIYDKDTNKTGYFIIDATRDPKGDYKTRIIPCKYDFSTKILNIREDKEDDQ